MTEQEQWRTVVGFPDYEVSDLGRVLSRQAHRRWGTPSTRLLRGAIDKDGYRCISLVPTGGGRVLKRVHQIVAEAFLGPRPEGMEVCHNNGDRTNDRADNLRWDTHAENMRDIVRHKQQRRAAANSSQAAA